MIIYFVGKKGSGKSTCSQWLIDNHKFQKLSFAKPLKDSIANLYKIDVTLLGDLSYKEGKLAQPWPWNQEKLDQLCAFFCIKIETKAIDRVFETPREAMQYIGTDILRTYDPNFHINRAIPIISNYMGLGINVCLDDVRFINEVTELDNIGGIGIYIERPGLPSNSHISENELEKCMFTRLLLNNGTKEELIEDFRSMHYRHITKKD